MQARAEQHAHAVPSSPPPAQATPPVAKHRHPAPRLWAVHVGCTERVPFLCGVAPLNGGDQDAQHSCQETDLGMVVPWVFGGGGGQWWG